MEKYVKWFDDLLNKVPKPYHVGPKRLTAGHSTSGGDYLHADEASSWITQAGMAIESVIKPGDAPRKLWEAQLASISRSGNPTPHQMDQLRGIVAGVAELLRVDRLNSLIESVQADTLGELLDQAESLLAGGYPQAAAGIAGGALETHLRHLVDRHNLTVQGHGSIEKYNGLIGQERKAGNEIYSVGDTKQITSWGDIRNAADHRPLPFEKTKEEVSLMIQGIRNFLSRVP